MNHFRKKYIFGSLLLFLLVLTGCGDSGKENYVETTALIETEPATEQTADREETDADLSEKAEGQKVNTEEQEISESEEPKVYVRAQYKEYEICLVETDEKDWYQFVLKKDSEQLLLMAQKFCVQPEEPKKPEDFQVEPFDELMGFSGFYIFWREGVFPQTYYFGVDNGEPILLGEGWGNEADKNYITDVDQDGKSELVCNVVYGGDGAVRTFIYRYDGKQIFRGSGDDLLDEEYDYRNIGSEYSVYLPEENVIEIFYWIEKEGAHRSKKYKIDTDKMEWEPYFATES